MQGLGPLAVIPFSKCILGDTKRYSAGRPLLAMALVIASTVLAVLPMFPGVASVQNDVDLDGGNAALQFAWASVFAGGLVPDALSGVLSQLVVLRLVAAPRVHARLRHPGHQQHGGGTGGGKGVGEEDAAVGAPLLHHELGLSARGAFRAACAFALCYSCLNVRASRVATLGVAVLVTDVARCAGDFDVRRCWGVLLGRFCAIFRCLCVIRVILGFVLGHRAVLDRRLGVRDRWLL